MSHDRTGEEIEPEDESPPAPKPHDPRCKKGWLGHDEEDRPIPCLQCRPKLAPEERRRRMGLGDKK